jgi:hypothetical protein
MAPAVMAEDDRLADLGDVARILVPSGFTDCDAHTVAAPTTMVMVTLLFGLVLHGDAVHNLAETMTWILAVALTVGPLAVPRWPCVAGLEVPRTSWRGVGRLRAFAPHPEGALRPRLVPLRGVARPPAFAPRTE